VPRVNRDRGHNRRQPASSSWPRSPQVGG
jgi:hypothetical protein